MTDLCLTLPSSQTEIHCGTDSFFTYAPYFADGHVFILTDSNVFALYRQLMWKVFGDNVPIYILPAGESGKNVKYLFNILREMHRIGMERSSILVAIGGGVVGDIGGLAASLYMRGVELVQIPTTLLAQVDSSIGGKTAVDFEGIKNLVGTFYQPRAVIADPLFLSTLPPREIRCGLGEIIKYGALNEEIFDKLFNNLPEIQNLNFLEEVIVACIEHKINIVEQDERDLYGNRRSLNLGHTTGHALELYYRKRSHGEYVLIGAYYELYIAQRLGRCGTQYANDYKKLISSVVRKIPYYDDIVSAAELAKSDKKNSDGKISVIAPAGKGVWEEIRLYYIEYALLLEECSKILRGDQL